MNDFLFAHKKSFRNSAGEDLTLFLDVNLKKNSLSNLQFKGTLSSRFEKEINQVVTAFLNKTLDSIAGIQIENSAPLWLLYSALDEYQGHVPVKHEDVVCLCFGITNDELKNGKENMAGRACGSCRPHIKKKEYKKIAGMYPGPLAVKLDELAREIKADVSIEEINDNYLEVKMNQYDKQKLQALSDYFFLKLNTRFFLRATL